MQLIETMLLTIPNAEVKGWARTRDRLRGSQDHPGGLQTALERARVCVGHGWTPAPRVWTSIWVSDANNSATSAATADPGQQKDALRTMHMLRTDVGSGKGC